VRRQQRVRRAEGVGAVAGPAVIGGIGNHSRAPNQNHARGRLLADSRPRSPPSPRASASRTSADAALAGISRQLPTQSSLRSWGPSVGCGILSLDPFPYCSLFESVRFSTGKAVKMLRIASDDNRAASTDGWDQTSLYRTTPPEVS
jgi:hypothetical protein